MSAQGQNTHLFTFGGTPQICPENSLERGARRNREGAADFRPPA